MGSARINAIRQRLAIDDVREPFKFAPPKEPYKLHKRSKEIESHGVKTVGESPTIKGSHFLTTDGKLIGSGKLDHRDMSDSILKSFPDKEFNKMSANATSKMFSRWGTDGQNMSHLLEQTGMSRISADKLGINIDSKHPLTKSQMSVINQWTEDNKIGVDNIFVDDYSNTQSIKKQLRLGSARIKSVRQRLAYTGKHFIKPKGTTNEMVNDDFKRPHYQDQQYTQRLDKVQKEFESMRPEILERKHGKDMGKYSVPGLNDYGSLCVDEATCGASSSALWNKLIESGFTSKQVQVVNGGYTGPGAEFSGAGISSGGKPFAGHAWLRLDDGTIIDGSAGQFMHQGTAPIERVKGKHDTKEHYEEKYSTEETREPKQKNRLRIIPPDSKLQKYYEPWFSEHPLTGRRKWFNKNNPMRKEIKKAERLLKRVEGKARSHRVAPKSARIQMARERLGAVGKVDWNNIIRKNKSHKQSLNEDMSHEGGFISQDGKFFTAYPQHESWLEDLLQQHGDVDLLERYNPNIEVSGEKYDSQYRGLAPWMQDTGMIRTRFDSGIPSIHTETEPTKQQIKTIGNFLKDNEIPSEEIVFEEGLGNYGGDVSVFTKMKRGAPHTHTQNIIGEPLTEKQLRESKLRQRIAVIGVDKFDRDERLQEVLDLKKKFPTIDSENKRGMEQDDKEQEYITKGKKVRPDKPTKKEWKRIIQAKQRIAGLGFRERILNWLKEQPRFKSFDPDSSFVGTVKYDQDNQSMQITLNGKKYDFCNVEERLFDSFSGAGSKGAFFNREIKSLHNCGAW